MNDDVALLDAFATRRDEAAFRQLVEQRIGFVYAIALRRLRDPHLAQEATQSVFIALARKAARVAQSPSVMGWLHRSCWFATRNLMRAQIHRTAREQEAHRRGTTTAAVPTGLSTSVTQAALGALGTASLLAVFFASMSTTKITATIAGLVGLGIIG